MKLNTHRMNTNEIKYSSQLIVMITNDSMYSCTHIVFMNSPGGKPASPKPLIIGVKTELELITPVCRVPIALVSRQQRKKKTRERLPS